MKKILPILILFQFSIFSSILADEANFRLRENQIEQGYAEADIEAEIQFGRNLAATILAKHKLHPNREVQGYIATLGTAIASQIGRDELIYYFAVIDVDDINAYACPGGYIFITKGAIQAMANEAQLAGVIAHEIGHVDHRHVVKSLKIRAKGDSATSGIAAAFGGTSATARILLDQLTEKAFSLLFEEGIAKDSEFEADSTGVEVLTALGYDWRSYRDYVSGLQGYIGKGQGQVLNKTHPSVAQRVDKITQFSNQSNFGELHGKTNTTRFQKYHRFL